MGLLSAVMGRGSRRIMRGGKPLNPSLRPEDAAAEIGEIAQGMYPPMRIGAMTDPAQVMSARRTLMAHGVDTTGMADDQVMQALMALERRLQGNPGL